MVWTTSVYMVATTSVAGTRGVVGIWPGGPTMVSTYAPPGGWGQASVNMAGCDPGITDPPTPSELVRQAELRVEGIIDSLGAGNTPELMEAILYRHLHYRGQRIERIDQRIERLSREGK